MELRDRISIWIKNYLEDNNLKSLIIGISGGIDSAVTSTLCAMTGKNTIVVTMPIHQNPNETVRGKKHIQWLKNNYNNIEEYHIDLSDTYEHLKKTIPIEFHVDNKKEYNLSLANTRARIRMSTLYLISGGSNGIVVGTGNKVEDFGVGFFTKYGDGGVDISPIGNLIKSEVYELGKQLGVISDILDARPTDGLWDDGRTDEDQLGVSYDKLEWAMEWYDKKIIGKDQNKNPSLDDLDKNQRNILEIYLKHRTKNLHKMKKIPVFKK